MVSELECVGHATSRIEQERSLLPGMPAVFDVTAESIMAAQYEIHEAVSELTGREFRIKQN